MRGASATGSGKVVGASPLRTRYSSSSFSRCTCSRSCDSFSSAPRVASSSSDSCLQGDSRGREEGIGDGAGSAKAEMGSPRARVVTLKQGAAAP